jgi:hypothetical protein
MPLHPRAGGNVTLGGWTSIYKICGLDAWGVASNVGVGVVMVGVAGTVDGDFGSGDMFEVAAGLVGEASVSDAVVANAELEDGLVVEDEREDWDIDVACGVIVCTEVMTSVVRTREPLGIVIVLVLDVKDVWVEGSKGAGLARELELEELRLVKMSEYLFTCRPLRAHTWQMISTMPQRQVQLQQPQISPRDKRCQGLSKMPFVRVRRSSLVAHMEGPRYCCFPRGV